MPMTFACCKRLPATRWWMLFAGAATFGLAGCAEAPPVVRVYQGVPVEGRTISPEAYAAYLNGVIAEESGDSATATKWYDEVLTRDPEAVLPPRSSASPKAP